MVGDFVTMSTNESPLQFIAEVFQFHISVICLIIIIYSMSQRSFEIQAEIKWQKKKPNGTERWPKQHIPKKKLFLIRFVPSPIVYVAGGYLSRLMARDDWELSQNTHSQCVWNTYRVTWKLYCLGSKVAKQRDTNENKTKQSRRDSNEIRLFDKVSLFSFKITNWNQNWHVQHPSAA